MKLRIEVPGEPVGQARARVIRTKQGIRGIDPAKSKNYKNWVKICALEALKKQSVGTTKLLELPLKINLRIYRSIQKSGSKKSKQDKETGKILPTVKPDIDNVFKAVTDALTKIIWLDDNQIVEAKMIKRYSNEPRVEIDIEELE